MDGGPRFAALSARLSGLDRLAGYIGHDDDRNDKENEIDHALNNTRQKKSTSNKHRTYNPEELVSTDGFGPLFMEPVAEQSHNRKPMTSIFDDAHDRFQSVNQQQHRGHPHSFFDGYNENMQQALPRHLREDPDLEGQRWTQAAESSSSSLHSARRLRPINLTSAPSSAAMSLSVGSNAPQSATSNQGGVNNNDAMLDQIVGRLKYEYAQKMAEERYITDRLVQLQINPEILNRRRGSALNGFGGPPGLERIFDPLSKRHASTSPMHMNDETAQNYTASAPVQMNGVAPGRTRTQSGAVLYTDVEIAEMEKIYEELGQLVREQKQLRAAHRNLGGNTKTDSNLEKKKLQLDSRILREQIDTSGTVTPEDEVVEGPRSLASLLAKAEKGETIMRRKIKPTYVGPRETVVKAMAHVLGQQHDQAKKSGVATPTSYSFASPRPATGTLSVQEPSELKLAKDTHETSAEVKEAAKEKRSLVIPDQKIEILDDESDKTPEIRDHKDRQENAKKDNETRVRVDEPIVVPSQDKLPSKAELLAKIQGLVNSAHSSGGRTLTIAEHREEQRRALERAHQQEQKEASFSSSVSVKSPPPPPLGEPVQPFVPPVPMAPVARKTESPAPAFFAPVTKKPVATKKKSVTTTKNGRAPGTPVPQDDDVIIELESSNHHPNNNNKNNYDDPALAKKSASTAAQEFAFSVAASDFTPKQSPQAKAEFVKTAKSEKIGQQKSTVTKTEKIAPAEANDDARRLEQRQKQIQFGYNTEEYKMYASMIPKNARSARDPGTPDPRKDCSKRSWDGQLREWRRALHAWQPPKSKTDALRFEQTDVQQSGNTNEEMSRKNLPHLALGASSFPDAVAVGDLPYKALSHNSDKKKVNSSKNVKKQTAKVMHARTPSAILVDVKEEPEMEEIESGQTSEPVSTPAILVGN